MRIRERVKGGGRVTDGEKGEGLRVEKMGRVDGFKGGKTGGGFKVGNKGDGLRGKVLKMGIRGRVNCGGKMLRVGIRWNG